VSDVEGAKDFYEQARVGNVHDTGKRGDAQCSTTPGGMGPPPFG